MNCETCAEKRKQAEPVPYIAHEADMARNERTIRRLITTLIIVLVLWFSSIGIFVWYLNQYDFESYSYEQDGQGVNIIGDRNGAVYYGAESYDPPTD